MSAKANPVIGAMVHKDGRLQPVEGSDPSTPGTYREEELSSEADQQPRKEPQAL